MHALRNVTKKLPERLHRELKARYWHILHEASSAAEAAQAASATNASLNSGLVKRVFELLEQADHQPRWLLLGNVPFKLERGDAMRYLARRLGELGYRWAYRVVDARAFGLPQRRQRVILLASQVADPREILFQGDRGEPETPDHGCRRRRTSPAPNKVPSSVSAA